MCLTFTVGITFSVVITFSGDTAVTSTKNDLLLVEIFAL